MSSLICGIGCILLGVFFPGIQILPWVRDRRMNQRHLNGKITAVDPAAKTLRVEYKIAKNVFHEIDWGKTACFLSGRIPPVGLRVRVKVWKDDLYNPLDVILLDRYTPFDPPGYLHNSTFFVILHASLLGAFFIFCGVLFLTGQFS